MRKILLMFSLFIFIVGLIFTGLIFTKSGNELLKPPIQNILNSKLAINSHLEKFELFPLNILLKFEDGSKIGINGEVSILSKEFDLDYFVKIKDLRYFKKLLQTKLRGPFSTKGKIKGSLDKFKIDGDSDVAKSATNYHLVIKDLNPTQVIADIKDAKIDELLYMLYQPKFINGNLNVNASLADLRPNSLKGDVKILVNSAEVDSNLMKKRFNISLPKTIISSETKAHLNGKMVKLDSKTDSNLMKINVGGDIEAEKLAFDLTYGVDIKRLELLKPITNANIRGRFFTKGVVKGDKKELNIKGFSDIAGSNTNYKVTLKDFSPSLVDAKIKGAKIEKLLYMLYLPKYASGEIASDIKIFDIKNLSAKIVSKISGVTNPKVLQREFDFYKANINLNLNQTTDIKDNIAISNIELNSNVANLVTKGAKFDLKNGVLDSKYTLIISDLNKLYFATKQKMRGSLKVEGAVKKAKNLIVTANSNTLGGKVNIKMVDEDLKAALKGIKVVELTDMLYYPKVFDSIMDANLDYNLASKKGKLLAKAFDGKILPNQMTFLLNQMAKFDITREIYKETVLKSDINDKVIISNLDMKSRLTHITSKNALTDLNKNYIDAKLQIDIKGKPLYVKIKGKIDSPKVSLDAKSLLKDRAKKEIEKRLKDKAGDKIKGILNLF